MLIPEDEEIVAMIEFKGKVMVATKRHVYQSEDGKNFELCISIEGKEGIPLAV